MSEKRCKTCRWRKVKSGKVRAAYCLNPESSFYGWGCAWKVTCPGWAAKEEPNE